MGMWSRLRRTFRSGTHDDEIKEELEFHLHGDATEGRSLRDARLRLGNPKRIQEETREAGIVGWLESVLQDARYGSRQFSRAPGLFLAVVLSLAIGIGANSAIFSLIDAAVLRPLPVADPGALFQLEWRNDEIPAGAAQLQRSPSSTDGGVQAAMVSEPVFRSLAEAETGLVSLVGLSGSTDEVGLSGAAGAPAQPVRRQYVSRSFFDGLGVPPVLGRGFIDEEDRPGAEPSVIVSHRFWSNSLGSDPDVIDGFVEINDQPVRLVGVAPPGFFGLNRGEWIDVYQPLGTHPFFNISVSGPYSPSTYWSVTAVARVASGESGSAAAARLTPLFRGLVAETTGTEIEDGLELVAVPAGGGLYSAGPRAVDAVSQALWVLMLLVGVLLLIVCANVSNLLLSRSETRRRESAVRLALGAGRGRLVRQHLVESGMLAIIGGMGGLLLGTILARSIHALFQTGQGSSAAFAVIVDWRVLAYAIGISVVTAMIFGLAPAWTAARSNVNDTLKIQSRSVLGGGLRVPRILVSVQFALSFAALVAAGLLGRSFENLYSTDLGFDSQQLSYATVYPGRAGVDAGPYMERLEQEIAAIPGVVMVAAVQRRPLDGSGGGSFVSSPNGPPATGGVWLNNPAARTSIVRGAPGFIEVLGIPLLSGRTLEVRDACDFPFFAPASEAAPGAPLCPVVVDDRFAEVFFPGEVPIGQHFEIPNITPAFDYQIVGVVANARLGVLREEAPPTMYSLAPAGFSIDHLAIRAEIGSGALATAVQQAVERVDAGVPLAEFHTQSGLIARLLRTELLLALVSGGFSLAALVLAAVGLGGLLAYSVARRTNEIGIRMALGASRGEVRRMVLGDSLSMVGLGLLIGIPAAWSVGRYLESQLFGLEPIDPMATSLALAALITIALIAAMLPARRASRINPLDALREE